MVSLSGFFWFFMLKKSGLIFKTPLATVSHTRHLGSFIMSMASSAIVLCKHRAVPFLSVLIRIHVIHVYPNTTVSSVNEHC